MTEEQWLHIKDSQAMTGWLHQQGKLSERKARLFAVACCRRRWDLLPHSEWRQAVEVSEQYADGQCPEQELERAWGDANDVFHHLAGELNVYDAMTPDEEPEFWVGHLATLVASREATDAARRVVEVAKYAELQEAPYLLRDLFGPLPFRPLPPLSQSLLIWHDGLVRRLAEEAYNHRVMPAGTLDPDRIAVLADALEEAGAEAELVEHLRDLGPHTRGCWVVDHLLGKE